MITKKHVMLITCGACILGLSALGSLKNPVTRPHKGVGQFHVVINVGNPMGTGDGSFDATGVGQGTHTGKFLSHLQGKVDPITLTPPTSGSLSGTVTAANGDQFFIRGEPDGSTTVTGGTGRFVGATGSQTSAVVGTPVVSYDPGTGTLTIDATETLEGTLTY